MDWNCALGKRIFPDAVWQQASESLFLTFDDGPHPAATIAILEVLKTHRVKATFFVLGMNVRAYPDIARRIVNEGHTIASHGYSHTRFLLRPRAFVRKELELTNQEIRNATGVMPTLFRPPHGQFDWRIPALARSAGLATILWSVSSGDYSAETPSKISKRIVDRAGNGDILLLHDNARTEQTTPAALDTILRWGRDRQLSFEALRT